LIDFVVEILRDPPPLTLLSADPGSRRFATFGLEPAHHPIESRVEPFDFRARVARSGMFGLRGGEVDLLHGADHPIKRLESTVQQQPVAEQGREDGESEYPSLAAVRETLEMGVDGDGGDEHRSRDKQEVDGQDLS
jgi:hypothetical protein